MKWLLMLLVLLPWMASDTFTGVNATGVNVQTLGTVVLGGFACNDGIDNDSDGIADYPGDMGCTSPYDTSEGGDNMVIVGGTISSTQLNNCINGSDQGTNGNLCNNVAGAKLANTTVIGCASSLNNTNVCSVPTLQTVSDAYTVTFTNTAFNSLRFSNAFNNASNCFGITITNQRFVHDELLITPNGCRDLGSSSGATGLLVDHSLIDGGLSAGPGSFCLDIQWSNDSPQSRFTNNTIQNFCSQPPPNDHAEALYNQQADGLYVAGNMFEGDYGTASIFFTDDGVPENFAQNICVRDNLFGPNNQASSDIAVRTGTSSGAGNTIFVEGITSNRVNPATRTVAQKCNDPDGNPPFVGPVETCFILFGGTRSCRQCNDGIDNDGDGKADFWPDGNGDPQCSGFGDNDESS